MGSVAAGDGEAFAELMTRHTARILDFATTLLGDRRDAEDATQETLIDAYRSAGKFDGRADAKAWLLGIAYNRCRRWRRERRRRDISLDDLAKSPDGIPGDAQSHLSSDPETIATQMDIDRALSGLADEYRLPIVLRFQQGLSYAEIAQVLGISDSAAAMRLHRGRALLRERLGHLIEGEEVGKA